MATNLDYESLFLRPQTLEKKLKENQEGKKKENLIHSVLIEIWERA